MMINNLDIKSEYRPGRNNAVTDFFVPVLANAVRYKRAVGFFSSTALVKISKGLAGLIKNGGTVELIVSPKLTDDDVQAIDLGYKKREEIIETAMMREFTEPKTYYESERLNMLATLIANGKLDIKVAFTKNPHSIGMYHEKMGLIYDEENNIVAFSGSSNETGLAMEGNYDVFDTYCSWQSEFEKKKVLEKEFAFHCLWTNSDGTIDIYDFPNVAKEKLEQYKREEIDIEIERKEEAENPNEKDSKKNMFFRCPVKLHDYQQEAISKWIKNGYKGIFDMATGTGKTYTGLGALSELSIANKDRLGVVIVCPYQHLVEQWVEDIRKFNVEPIICYSKYEWKKKLSIALTDFKLGVRKNFCAVFCSASFAIDEARDMLERAKGNLCLLVDEAHNAGSEIQRKRLLQNFPYRLGLSATIERYQDESGTSAIYDYFGEKCIEYSLNEAIENGYLSHYKYHPVVIGLDFDEQEQYNNLSDKIAKQMAYEKSKDNLSQSTKMLLIKRARIIAGARNKVSKLKELMEEYKDKSNILVYCGATNYEDGLKDSNEDVRQIEEVMRILGNELGMRASTFTSKEKAQERGMIKNSFQNGSLQAVVAIKCLDEGVNIPGISTAFILASSTNPKEYIQRRGRVLRQAVGKEYAVIYDFVTLPDLDSEKNIRELKYETSLIRRELARMNDFKACCDNKFETEELIDRLKNKYDYYLIGDEENEF